MPPQGLNLRTEPAGAGRGRSSGQLAPARRDCICARQRHRPRRHRRRAPHAGHRQCRQGLSRCAPGTRRSGLERRALPRARHPRLQAGPDLADGPRAPRRLQAPQRGTALLAVVEEKRLVMEDQIARHLYSLSQQSPALAGKQDLKGATLLPATASCRCRRYARPSRRCWSRSAVRDDAVVASTVRQLPRHRSTGMGSSAAAAPARLTSAPAARTTPARRSRRRARARRHRLPWSGRASSWTATPCSSCRWATKARRGCRVRQFVDRQHVFQNMGDGTYSHSGILAIRAAVASKANITYKVLYNDAVAMTGGQPVEQADHADGHGQSAAVGRRAARCAWCPTTRSSTGRSRCRRTSRCITATISMRSSASCSSSRASPASSTNRPAPPRSAAAASAACWPDPDQRVFINPAVCEGCGDCSVQSNCISVLPLETEFGRKRKIDQSTCNKDYSCVKGFCPSFVTVTGAKIAVRSSGDPTRPAATDRRSCRAPAIAALDERGCNILVGGIGGTGVLTIGALLGMAAHLDQKGCTISRPDRHGAEGRLGHQPHPHRPRSARTSTPRASARA